MDVRPYITADRDGCLAVFDSNTPMFFRPHERGDFETFLSNPNCPYFVVEHEGGIACCGGYFLSMAKAARLVWGIVRRDLHRQGLGRFLLLYRLRELAKAGEMETVSLETSQYSALFFQRQGFHISRVSENEYGPGLDKVEMIKKLTVCP